MVVALAVSALAAGPISAAHAYELSGPTNTDVPPLTVTHGLQYVAIADFNADSDPDLALAHEDAYKVSVLLGGAGGSFGAPADVPLGSSSNPLSVAVGNFNGDSDPDLVTANEGSNTPPPAGWISILLGGAGGSFAAPISFNAGEKPQEVAVGDFNGDGDSDLAVANASPSLTFGTVSVLLGTAGVSFSAPTNYTVGNSPRAVAIGDFNGDSDPDLVVASQGTDKVTVLLGGAGGTFTVQPDLSACGTPNSLAVADFNGDSDPDIAAVNETCNNVSVWIGGSGSSFGARTDFPVGNLPDRITTGDLNGDSKTDIAVANQISDNISLLLGLGTGSFMPQLNFGAADGPTGIAIGQFNADGRSDLAVTNEISNNVSIFLGVQDGYARPKGATPLTFRLVPAFLECTAANASHGPPLDSSSCSPPVQASSYLTLNAPDRPAPFNTAAGSSGLLTMAVFCTDGAPSPCTAAAGDQIDVKIDSTITDVRCLGTSGGCSAAGATYSGKLLINTALRLTDRTNVPVQEPATAMDTQFQLGMQCASGACSVATTADAVIPGFAVEQKRAVWEVSRIEVRDGGSDGDLVAAPPPASGVCPPACVGNGGETLFLHQGIFVP